MCKNRSPLQCVVPPYLLDAVIKNGTDKQRSWASRSLASDHRLRTARVTNVAVRAGGPREGADALAGAAAQPTPDRIIRDAQGGWEVTGIPIVRREGDPSNGDADVDRAYDGLGDTHAFWLDVFGRESIDDENMPLRGIVHFGEEYDNAFWDGRRMVFGDGDGELFVSFTKSLDVIGHELGHGVIEDEAGLEYWGQSGALNESLADVWGSLVKQRKLGQSADQADWLIGAEIIGDEFDGVALRSMSNPGSAYDDAVLGKDPQPKHWDDYVRTWEDEGGVHINSGIPNHAFWRLATQLGGNAWERPGRIWYDALRHSRLRTTATFRDFARITHEVAQRAYGNSSAEASAVQEAWDFVGVRWPNP
jgi:Zn-dependent metalloprotease